VDRDAEGPHRSQRAEDDVDLSALRNSAGIRVMNRSPLRPISQDDVDTYERVGAVCLRRVFDRDWIDALLPIARRLVVDGEDLGLPPLARFSYMSRVIPEFRELALNSPLGEACGRTLRSSEIRFYFDQIFGKAPRSTSRTVWHNDRPGWPVTGCMVPSFWMPLTPITRRNSLEVIAGTHRHDVRYWNLTNNSRKMLKPPGIPNVPDGEQLRAAPGREFLAWDMEPGDALLLHPWTLHYSAGNPTDAWRIAISIRVFGDDIRWDPRPECVNLAGCSFDEMIPGERPAGPVAPLVWSADGRRDPPEEYLRGFATRWSPEAWQRVVAAMQRAPSYEADVAAIGGPSRLA
jgi:ectoine hydroxylase-related dioxygenase (phytanoyl-CoA dioxygenase family)